jgi:hypothetical protein
MKGLIVVVPHVHMKKMVDKTAHRKFHPRDGYTPEKSAQKDLSVSIASIDAMKKHSANASRDDHGEMCTPAVQ